MLATRNIREFITHNDQEFRCMVNTICQRLNVRDIDDAIQDAYTHILTANILSRYDPSRAKISTYLYPIVNNLVLSKKMGSSEVIRDKKYRAPEDSSDTGDAVELALRYNRVAAEFQNIIHQNEISDGIDGLGAELRDFEERYLPTKNKLFTLEKRKRQHVETNGFRLSDLYSLLYDGLNNKEIAHIYGISYMYVSSIKKELAFIMQKGGVHGKPKTKSRRIKIPPTLKGVIAHVLRNGPMTLPFIYKAVNRIRKGTPPSSIRARIYGSIQKSEGIFTKCGEAEFGIFIPKSIPDGLKGQIAFVLENGSMALPEIYSALSEIRPTVHPHSVRARIYGSIQKNEGIFKKIGEGEFGLA